ncbi:MAG: DUF2254 domain-containing protein [Saprospiraceae bacterium]|nr:DUF2254 domain-containing protein [Saprospiraceae bacterium]
MKKLIFFWKELQATFWFLPVLIICMAVILSIGLVSLDNSITISQEGWLRFFLVNSPDSARSILSTISGAMIGVAGTVFSVTLVALTLASSQFGPRLIRNFMYVKLNQIVLGSYVATYLYCLLVLNSIKDNDGYTFIPSISILLAIFVAMANIVLLIIFIHQIAVSIQADRVISEISDFIANQLKTLFPEKMGEQKESEGKNNIATTLSAYQKQISIKSPKNGYLQYISSEVLVDLVSKQDSLLKVHYKPGSFLVKDIEIAELLTHSNWEQDQIERLLNQFVIGKTKTPQQDLEYSIHQMVEIASRALSPGVNDPYTAIACIDNLTSTMVYLAQAKFPSKYRYDEEGDLRVIAKALDFEGILDAAFNQIRQFSAGSTAVIIRLMEALTIIQKFTKSEDHKKAVIKHAKMILSLGEQTIKEKNDIEDLRERARIVLE